MDATAEGRRERAAVVVDELICIGSGGGPLIGQPQLALRCAACVQGALSVTEGRAV